MVELKNLTAAQLEKVLADEDQHEKDSVGKLEKGENPWPSHWAALRDLTVGSDKVIKWLADMIKELVGRRKDSPALCAPILLRAFVAGYNAAKVQMTEELEKVVH